MLLNFADITLTRKGSLYHEITEKIKFAVSSGVIKSGERMPSVREAASQLGVSRTTVENAYTRLCIEGVIESRPQRGYFVLGVAKANPIKNETVKQEKEIIYDFSSRLVDKDNSDTELWKKLIRDILRDTNELNSYGDPQGELNLRCALADYSYKARGVTALAENIIIGAGVGPLLNILCSLLKKDITVGFENGGFKEAEQIFGNYGIKTSILSSDKSGAEEDALKTVKPDVLFLLPSALSKISPTALSRRRNAFLRWAKSQNRLIIEDDYNGELRYTARSVPAFQPKSPQNTVYIGSFSKLLLPSVRIAYMVLPDFLAEKFKNARVYNQTCGKIEQLALEKYIVTGALEKHLKKLRRIYYTKSQLVIKELENGLCKTADIKLFESSLTVEIKLNRKLNTENLQRLLTEKGIKIADSSKDGNLKLSFSGITADKIPQGIKLVTEILQNNGLYC